MSVLVTKSRNEFAQLANHLVQCSGVTFNDSDVKKNFTKFKIFCGKIANFIQKEADAWNDEALKLNTLTEDELDALEDYEGRMEEIKKNVSSKKERKKERIELKEDYKPVLDKEKSVHDNIKTYFDGEVTLTLPVDRFPLEDAPLNINGAYLDKILDIMEA